jgi:NAD(P)-dependent dehydrogenase (short-subunit alcohol dehydrogenase family)
MASFQLTKPAHKAVYPSIDPSNPKLSAAGKTIVISGGAGGIGYAIAQGFCIAGARRVIILTRRQEALDSAAAGLASENKAAGRSTEIWTYLLDIKDTASSEKVFESIRERLNEGAQSGERKIDADVLVLSAAQIAQGELSLVCDPDIYYRDAFETNVLGNLGLVRAFLAPEIPSIPFTSFDGIKRDISSAPEIVNKKTILDISSMSVYTVFPGQASYAASKGAFTRIMLALHAEVDIIDGRPIRVHSFHPGKLLTPGAKGTLDETEIKKVIEFDDMSLPQGFAVWLASDEAEFLRGRFLESNWDVDELVALNDRFAADPTFGAITLKY